MWIDIAFYIVLLSQVLLVSYYYPKQLLKRSTYVLETCPPELYPKLYENAYYAKPETVIKKVLNRYKYMNFGIGLFGISILVAMAVTGYAPRHIKENEHVLLVLFFAALQMVPYLYIELSTWKWYAHMRAAVSSGKRSAELKPRKLFDFVSPYLVILAAALFVGWLTYYIIDHSDGAPWQWNQYVTVICMSAANLLFAVMVFMAINGKKLDPHEASQDRKKRIEAVVQIQVFASLGTTLALITSDLINTYRLDSFEPLFLSVYIQLAIIFGVGQVMRKLSVETIDFDVYKAEAF